MDKRCILRGWRGLFQLIACLAYFTSPGEFHSMVALYEDSYYTDCLIELQSRRRRLPLGRDRKCGSVSEHKSHHKSCSKKCAQEFVNHTFPAVGLPQIRDLYFQSNRLHLGWWPASVRIFGQACHAGSGWEDTPLSASPFLGSYICLAWIFFVRGFPKLIASVSATASGFF